MILNQVDLEHLAKTWHCVPLVRLKIQPHAEKFECKTNLILGNRRHEHTTYKTYIQSINVSYEISKKWSDQLRTIIGCWLFMIFKSDVPVMFSVITMILEISYCTYRTNLIDLVPVIMNGLEGDETSHASWRLFAYIPARGPCHLPSFQWLLLGIWVGLWTPHVHVVDNPWEPFEQGKHCISLLQHPWPSWLLNLLVHGWTIEMWRCWGTDGIHLTIELTASSTSYKLHIPVNGPSLCSLSEPGWVEPEEQEALADNDHRVAISNLSDLGNMRKECNTAGSRYCWLISDCVFP